MRFKLEWASVGDTCLEIIKKQRAVKKAGFEVESQKERHDSGTLFRKCYVRIDTLEDLKRLDEVTGKHGLVIAWEEGSPLLEYPRITIYDGYME